MRRREAALTWLAAAGLAAAELVVAREGSIGVVLYGVLAVVLLLAGGRAAGERLRAALWSLAVLPINRLVALGAPLETIVPEARVAFVGLLTLLATVVAIRACGLTAAELGLAPGWRQVPFAVGAAVVGLGLGVAERGVVGGAPFADPDDGVLVAMFIGLSLVDGLLFSGLLLGAGRRVMGGWAVLFVALVAAALHLGFGPAPLVAASAVVAAALAAVRLWSRSLPAALAGHLALTLGLLVVGPEIAPSLQRVGAGVALLVALVG